VLWLATSVGLFAYVQRLATYESTYGSLAGVAISMLWLWISVFLVLVLVLVGAAVKPRRSARPPGTRPSGTSGRWASGGL
jgi:membrane protein